MRERGPTNDRVTQVVSLSLKVRDGSIFNVSGSSERTDSIFAGSVLFPFVGFCAECAEAEQSQGSNSSVHHNASIIQLQNRTTTPPLALGPPLPYSSSLMWPISQSLAIRRPYRPTWLVNQRFPCPLT